MMGEGLTYRARQQERVSCPDCEADLAAGYLTAHCQSQHEREKGTQWVDYPPPPDEYEVYFLWVDGSVV